MINLEIVLVQEIKLWTILQQMQLQSVTKQELMILCEEWWESSKDATLFDLYKIYRDGHTRKIIRKVLIYESILLIVTAYLLQQQSQLPLQLLTHLLAVAHENMLHLVCLVLQRMGLENCGRNVWAVALKEVVEGKGREQWLYMGEELRCAEVEKTLEGVKMGILRIEKGLLMGAAVAFVVTEIERVHVNRVKEILIKALN